MQQRVLLLPVLHARSFLRLCREKLFDPGEPLGRELTIDIGMKIGFGDRRRAARADPFGFVVVHGHFTR